MYSIVLSIAVLLMMIGFNCCPMPNRCFVTISAKICTLVSSKGYDYSMLYLAFFRDRDGMHRYNPSCLSPETKGKTFVQIQKGLKD